MTNRGFLDEANFYKNSLDGQFTRENTNRELMQQFEKITYISEAVVLLCILLTGLLLYKYVRMRRKSEEEINRHIQERVTVITTRTKRQFESEVRKTTESFLKRKPNWIKKQNIIV